MKERGIMFTGAMVRGILVDEKTQTRRILKSEHVDDAEVWADCRDGRWESGIATGAPGSFGHGEYVRCPYGVAGDRLWVRETHAQFAVGNRTGTAPQCVAYRATCDANGGFTYVNNGDEIMQLKITKWTPAIHMPRWASRATLDVTAVRVERLHGISDADAWAEGIGCVSVGELDAKEIAAAAKLLRCPTDDGRAIYGALWAKINGRESLIANPWVWVVDFKRVVDAKVAA